MGEIQQIGEKLSLFQLFQNKNYFIEVPIIQRDFAQGRNSAKEIRSRFLQNIKSKLDKNEHLELDFIYGDVHDKKFVPLDGQQRITTLFLLHWYIAMKDGMISNFRNTFVSNGKSKFTYETRISSREFCHSLICKDFVIPDKCMKMSDEIRDKNWYFISWDKDPTIDSMLNVLDTIHEIFCGSKGFYSKLTDTNNLLISFHFIELKDFGLSDALYIKMNARGKELTPFENFRAKIEQILEIEDMSSGTTYKKEFANSMDNEWTDLFWNNRNLSNSFDDEFMNFIITILCNRYITCGGNDNNVISKLLYPTEPLNYYSFSSQGLIDIHSIKEIEKFLGLVAGNNGQFVRYLSDVLTLDELNLFQKVIKNNISYTERIRFYALYMYLIENGSASGIDEWIRVVRNLTENTRIDEIEDFVNALNSIRDILSNSKNILSFLANDNNDIKGFLGSQVKEERLKASLILRKDGWESRIKMIESHEYFKGQIGFLLKFCLVEDAYNSRKKADFDSVANKMYQNAFDVYIERLLFIFNENGIKELPNFTLERALLSFGNYLLPKTRNLSFVFNGKDRDISWKRLLRDDDQHRVCFKNLIEKIDTKKDLQVSLQEIIKSAKVSDWRRYFIEFPETIKVCEKRFIRVGKDSSGSDNYNDILLLEKTQTNGMHREYYSYSLKCRLDTMGNTTEYHGDYSVDEWKYIKEINGHRVRISYWEEGGGWNYIFGEGSTKLYFSNQEDVIKHLKSQKIIN